jgi:hypothetical protein
LRIVTGKSVHFIKKVPSELSQILGNENTPTKKLLKVYNGSITKEGNSEMEIREISTELGNAINKLQLAAAHIYWLDKDLYKEKKKYTIIYIKRGSIWKKLHK